MPISLPIGIKGGLQLFPADFLFIKNQLFDRRHGVRHIDHSNEIQGRAILKW